MKKILLRGKKLSFLLEFPHFTPLKIRQSACSFNSYIIRPNNSLARMVKWPWRLCKWGEVSELRLLCSIDALVICSLMLQLWAVWRSDIMEVQGDMLWLMQQCVWCGLWHEGGAELKTSLTHINKQSPWLLTILHLSWETCMWNPPSSHS